MSSSHVTYTLLPEAAICGSERNSSIVTQVYWMYQKLVPLLLLAAKKISLLPGVSSSHVTYTLLPDVAICGSKEEPVLLLMFIVGPKLVPLLLLAAKKISKSPGVASSHATYTLLPDVAICGSKEKKLQYCY